MGRIIRSSANVATALAVAMAGAPAASGAVGVDAAAPIGLSQVSIGSGAWGLGFGLHQDPQARDTARRDAWELMPATIEAEIDRRFNDLRTDVLASQAATVNWWLRMMAVILTFFGIGVPLLGLLGFNRFREIERDVKQSAAAVAEVAESARFGRPLDLIATMDARAVVERPGTARQIARQVGEDSGASLIELAWVEAWRHQMAGRRDEAVQKWGAIARIAEAGDARLAAAARASVAFLSQDEIDDGSRLYLTRGTARLEAGQNHEAIAAYDKAIRLDPADAAAYVMRGFAKGELGMHEEAIADYDEGIRLKPDDAFSFLNRGRARWEAGRQDEAIEDFDAAIALEPHEGGTFLARGVLKRAKGLQEEARRDLESAFALAQKAGDDELAAKAESFLRSGS